MYEYARFAYSAYQASGFCGSGLVLFLGRRSSALVTTSHSALERSKRSRAAREASHQPPCDMSLQTSSISNLVTSSKEEYTRAQHHVHSARSSRQASQAWGGPPKGRRPLTSSPRAGGSVFLTPGVRATTASTMGRKTPKAELQPLASPNVVGVSTVTTEQELRDRLLVPSLEPVPPRGNTEMQGHPVPLGNPYLFESEMQLHHMKLRVRELSLGQCCPSPLPLEPMRLC